MDTVITSAMGVSMHAHVGTLQVHVRARARLLAQRIDDAILEFAAHRSACA